LGDLGTTATVLAPPPPPVTVPKIVRVGGVIREPRKLVHVAPVYPEIARLSRVQRIVTMEAILDATGRVESVRVLSSSPCSRRPPSAPCASGGIRPLSSMEYLCPS
jgi:outer membrane biosynthesis protein TonB